MNKLKEKLLKRPMQKCVGLFYGLKFAKVYKKREDRYVYLSLPLNQLTKSKFYEKIHYKDGDYFGGCKFESVKKMQNE
jgi:hypothetical protein